MDGYDKTFAVIGHPVLHSLSPVIHHAAYLELGMPGHSYLAVDCPDENAVARQLAAIRHGELAGCNVTVPWKRLALESADELHVSARDTGAANVICPSGPSRRLVAHNTDVPALAEELGRGRPGARAATIIGSGGAALAAVVACRSIGVESIAVVARRFRGTDTSEWPLRAELTSRGATLVAWPDEPRAPSRFAELVVSSDIVVQTTSDGMSGASDGTSVRDLIPFGELSPNTFVYDVVYNPGVTPFVSAARGAGLTAQNGLGMLVGQAALAIELWLGKKPEPGGMLRAAEKALAEKTRRG